LIGNSEIQAWQQSLRTHYLPDVMLFPLAENAADLPEALSKPGTQQTTAWLCQGTQCLPPITSQHALFKLLQLPEH